LIAYDPKSGAPVPLHFIGMAFLRGFPNAMVGQVLDRRKNPRTVDGYEYYVHFKETDRRMDCWITKRDFHFVKQSVVRLALEEINRKKQKDTHDENHDHDHKSRVKNITQIMIGGYLIDAWYFSPFPVEVWQKDRSMPKNKTPDGRIFFCDFCLDFFPNEASLEHHLYYCELYHPPGNEIYRKTSRNKGAKGRESKSTTISMFEVDGFKERQYCQNISYLAKLFLDHKTLHYDVEPFLFYVMTEVTETGCHIVGYFSKEKWSEPQNNLACILTLPNHQRKGYGSFLMRFSYELSKIEKKWGSPEKPLSDLGRLGYIKFWKATLIDIICELIEKKRASISIKQLQELTMFSVPDIQLTLKEMGALHYDMGTWSLRLTQPLIDAHKKRKKRQQKYIQVDPKQIKFVPYDGAMWLSRSRAPN